MRKKRKPIFGEWQICPKCGGNEVIGTDFIGKGYTSTSTYFPCNICKGTGIIQKPIINISEL